MNKSYVGKLSLQEVLVDLFGSLLPGLVFVSLVIVLWSWPVVLLVEICGSPDVFCGTELARPIQQIVKGQPVAIAAIGVILSYVIGHLLYRRDPYFPDTASWRRIEKRMVTEDERRAWVITSGAPYKAPLRFLRVVVRSPAARRRLLQCNWIENKVPAGEKERWITDEPVGHFPYPNLKAYLTCRGLNHLADMVPWDADNYAGKCSKQFINVLKIRLAFHYPERIGPIVRNEAHVRWMSSTWYMAHWIRTTGGIAVVVVIGQWLIARELELQSLKSSMALAIPVSTILSVIALVWFLKRNIEHFFQYLRVREAVYVLETAYTAFSETPSRIWDICPGYQALEGPAHSVPIAATSIRQEPAEHT